MYFFKIYILMFFGLPLSLNAQNTPKDFLHLHNEARARVGVGPMTWNITLAEFADNYAQERKDCELIHSESPYGENIAFWSDASFTAKDAMNMWMGEVQYYDYKTNTCAKGKDCLHYTQILWRNSTRLGCARVECDMGGTFITCNYDPPGNVIGERPF